MAHQFVHLVMQGLAIVVCYVFSSAARPGWHCSAADGGLLRGGLLDGISGFLHREFCDTSLSILILVALFVTSEALLGPFASHGG
jgi:hypothetical protein